ncbi:ABC transporter permease [Angustibacter aerolatus]
MNASAVLLVARRELVTRLVNKVFLISTAVMLVLLVAGTVVGSVVSKRSEPPLVGLVGAPSGFAQTLQQAGAATGTPVRVRELPDAAAARGQVQDGTVKAALVSGGEGRWTTVTKTDPDGALPEVLAAATRQAALDAVLQQQGVDRGAVTDAVQRATPAVQTIEPADPDRDQRRVVAYVGVFLLFFSVYLYGLYVAMGVVEEKSSRVVELLLATIRPLDLLVGKVLGIGAVGLLQVALFGGAALLAGSLSGLVTIGSSAVAFFASMLVFYVLGFAFYAVLYAAAGSLVSRQEDVNSVTTPMNLLAVGSFLLAQYTLGQPDSTLSSVLAWVPPFSAMLVPVRIALGVSGWPEAVGSALLLLVVTALAAVLAARVYQHSVLQLGRKRSWREAVGRSARASS